MVQYHHEHRDGKVYPEGLNGQQILQGVRVPSI
jgi:HD-GYP domain-containing protein (c-di-GMP phosphodiesterase class II)